MKRFKFGVLLTLLFSAILIQGNAQNSLSEINISTVEGASVSSKSLVNDGDPYIICFWKSCCNSSIKFMEALNEVYPDLVDDYNIKVFAIAIDDSRTSDKVRPLVTGNSWGFEFYLDINERLTRAMNINLTPHASFMMKIIIWYGRNPYVWREMNI